MATNQKPISKSLTDSDKLLKLSWKAKCFYIFQKLHSDNLATIKANPYFLKGELYPKDDSITPEIIKEIIKECVEAGLLIHYKNNGIEYLHDPQAGNHEKIVGNMSEKGEYPLPEKQQITAWEQRFNGVYTQIYRKKPFKTQKIGGKNGEKPLKSVNTPSKSVSPEDRRLKIEDRRLKIEDKIFLSEFSNENYGRLVFLLRDLILQNNSKAKITNSQLKNWYKEVRLMVERDNRTLEEIEFVITKSQDDSFWKENILSMEKLREKFDQLWIKFKNENIGFRGRKLSEADKAFKKQLEEEGY